MRRAILSVLAGYVAMVAMTLPVFGIVYWVPDFVFEKGTVEASLTFSLLTIICGFLGAIVGGAVARRVAQGKRVPVLGLAGVVLALGVGMAVAECFEEAPSPLSREEIESLSVDERLKRAREPTWYRFLTPCVGGLGIAVGGGLLRRRRGDSNPPDQ
ncbi:MAG: hypothetical protein AAF517_04315 [Planctomycetota bacterium]